MVSGGMFEKKKRNTRRYEKKISNRPHWTDLNLIGVFPDSVIYGHKPTRPVGPLTSFVGAALEHLLVEAPNYIKRGAPRLGPDLFLQKTKRFLNKHINILC